MDTTTAYEQSLERFIHKRDVLNARLDATRREIDSILDPKIRPSVTLLATLEVLLKERRDQLAELAVLDDDFMSELLKYLPSLRESAEA
jgi:hypothetical protein